MRETILWMLAACAALSYGTFCLATEEYAESTDLQCSSCHIADSGGGELTQAGESYLSFLTLAPDEGETAPPDSATGKILRGVVGYVHVFTGLFWFGTILYVHIVLKPSYASKGLPRSEVKVGLASMAIMGVTGATLTIDRVPSPAFLVETRFGVLLLIKIGIYLAMVSSAAIVVLFIGPRLRKKASPTGGGTPEILSAEQLMAFDGAEGRRAYVGYSGAVYDVTANRAWAEGSHFGKHQAGRDLTSVISHAPHGEEWILNMPRVGKLAAPDTSSKQPPTERLFYFMTYFNLVNVCLVILVLVLWRWW